MKQDDLEKGLNALRAAAEDGNPAARRQELFAKSEDGTISDEERQELIKSLGGGNSLVDQVSAPYESDELQKSIEVSEYLKEHNIAELNALSILADQMEKSEAKSHDFRLALAQTLTSFHDLVKSQNDRIESLQKSIEDFGGQPARAPRSKMAGQPEQNVALQKSGGGAHAGGDGLGRGDILGALEDMAKSSENGLVAGQNIMTATAKFESTGAISPGVYSAVQEYVRNKNQAA